LWASSSSVACCCHGMATVRRRGNGEPDSIRSRSSIGAVGGCWRLGPAIAGSRAVLAVGRDRGVGQGRVGKGTGLPSAEQGTKTEAEHRGSSPAAWCMWPVLVRMTLERTGVCMASVHLCSWLAGVLRYLLAAVGRYLDRDAMAAVGAAQRADPEP
jgi:hypothetical protein